MKDRIRQVRKYFKLTQGEFGQKIGVKQNTVTGYESGIRSPNDAVILSICREFRVNEAWLRAGEGDMFLPATNSALEAMAEERGLPRSVTVLVEKFLDLDPRIQQGILDYMQAVVDAINAQSEDQEAADRKLERDGLHRELDRQLDLEETKKSGVS